MNRLTLSLAATLFSLSALATDEDSVCHKTIHRIEADFVPGAILHTNEYLSGSNPELRTMNHAAYTHLKYAFMMPENSKQAQIYKGAYQGVGVAFHNFNPQLGNPVSAYIFQGARIATLSEKLSACYEWNLGLTFGWNPYDKTENPDNRVIGSRVTAYINAGLYLSYRLAPWLDANVGASVAHFSNGNTSYPNGGLNTLGAHLGLAYYINRQRKTFAPSEEVEPFRRHWSCDFVVYGAWRRCGMLWDDGTTLYAVPGTYGVVGLNINPMYNVSHWFNAGVSLDYVYDHSANIYYIDNIVDDNNLVVPSASRQMALGLSARAEFTMPYFSINLGIGHNFVNATGSFEGFYEIIALKMHVYRGTFVHIGYSLSDFRYPNHLMLGLGYRL